jgi:iron complex outermembrane receptor protein
MTTNPVVIGRPDCPEEGDENTRPETLMTTNRFHLTPLAAALAFLAASPAARAQAPAAAPAASASAPADAASANAKGGAELTTVVVTAERRSADIQKTSISMQAISGSEIAEQGLSTGADILKNIANVEVQGAARGNLIAIRGIGSDMPPGMGESAVSTNYDGVYNYRAESASLGFFDLDRVEVLRGPQGTLYGRNAASGAVNFITRDPVIGARGGDASLEVGSYALLRGEFGIDVPVSDTVAIRASGASISRNGFLTDGYDDAKATGGRVKLLYKPNADFRALLGAEKIHTAGKGVGFVPDANWNDSSTRLTAAQHLDDDGHPDGAEKVGYQSFDSTKYWAQIDANVGFATLTLIPSYQHDKGEVYRKWDASHMGSENWSYDPNPTNQKSMEARLSSNDKAAALQWVAGAYYYDMRSILTCMLNCQLAETIDTTRSKAVFGQGTYSFTPALRFIGGLRHTEDKKTNIYRPDGETWSSTDGKLSVEYDLAPAVMSYVTASTAYRPGGFNTFNAESPRFGAEHLRNYELGLKSRFLENRVQFNGALFQMDYKGYQAIDNYLNPNASGPNDPNFFLSTVMNVPHQTIRGAEFDTQAILPTNTMLHASVTWLDAKLGDLILHDFATAAPASQEGKPLPHAPDFSFKAGVEQPVEMFEGALTLRADARYVTKQYVSISESADTLQPSYAEYDLSAQYRPDSDKWGLNFYVKNVTNYVPKTAEFFGYLTVGAPRTYGMVLTSKF